jgi:hypothetical protein
MMLEIPVKRGIAGSWNMLEAKASRMLESPLKSLGQIIFQHVEMSMLEDAGRMLEGGS